MAKNKPKFPAQFAAIDKDEVPFAIILGESELQEGFVTVKEQIWETVGDTKQKAKDDSQGHKVARNELISWLKGSNAWKSSRI